MLLTATYIGRVIEKYMIDEYSLSRSLIAETLFKRVECLTQFRYLECNDLKFTRKFKAFVLEVSNNRCGTLQSKYILSIMNLYFPNKYKIKQLITSSISLTSVKKTSIDHLR